MRLTLPIIAAALATPALASPPGQRPASTFMPTGDQVIVHAATAELFRPSYATPSPKALVAKLNRLCESKRQRDQRQCETAWARINAEYARMQAEKAAQD